MHGLMVRLDDCSGLSTLYDSISLGSVQCDTEWSLKLLFDFSILASEDVFLQLQTIMRTSFTGLCLEAAALYVLMISPPVVKAQQHPLFALAHPICWLAFSLLGTVLLPDLLFLSSAYDSRYFCIYCI